MAIDGSSWAKVKWALLVAAIGVVMMLTMFVGRGGGREPRAPALEKASETEVAARNLAPRVADSYEEQLEARTAAVLQEVRGAGTVVVDITLEHGGLKEYAKDTTAEQTITSERDSQGGTRQVTTVKEESRMVLLKSGSAAGETPVVVKEESPAVKGVLVVAEGAQDSGVRRELAKAVETLLGVPPHKVMVLPRKR